MLAWEQQDLSRRRAAHNQCPECGAFRLDGKPPIVHRTACSHGPSGLEYGVIELKHQGISPNPLKRPKLGMSPKKR
jgi:hypothetical protein